MLAHPIVFGLLPSLVHYSGQIIVHHFVASMDGNESGTKRCQSPEPLHRVEEEEADAIAPAPIDEIVSNRPVPPAKRSTKSPSVSFDIQDDAAPRRTDTFAAVAAGTSVPFSNQDDSPPRRTDTFASTASSVIDDAWVKQYVLSFGLYTRRPLFPWAKLICCEQMAGVYGDTRVSSSFRD